MHWKLTLPGYHTNWYKNYKTGVSTDRDSQVEGKEVSGGCTNQRETNRNMNDILLWTRCPIERNSSKLEARADAFWNVLERQLLVWLRVLVEIKSAHGSHSWT